MTKLKEPNFFALIGERLDFAEPDGTPAKINRSPYVDVDAYSRLFDSVAGETAVGEASVLYLRHPRAAERIHRWTPDAKLIALLRNPVESAFSEFYMNRGFGIEPCESLIDAIRDQERRIESNCLSGLYIQNYMHFQHIKKYIEIFPKSQLKIYLNEDFRYRPKLVLEDIFRYLGVDPHFSPEIRETINLSGIPKSVLIHRFLTIHTNPLASRAVRILPNRLQAILEKIRNWNIEKPAMAPEMRRQLIGFFRDDIISLQNYLERDLSDWLK